MIRLRKLACYNRNIAYFRSEGVKTNVPSAAPQLKLTTHSSLTFWLTRNTQNSRNWLHCCARNWAVKVTECSHLDGTHKRNACFFAFFVHFV